MLDWQIDLIMSEFAPVFRNTKHVAMSTDLKNDLPTEARLGTASSASALMMPKTCQEVSRATLDKSNVKKRTLQGRTLRLCSHGKDSGGCCGSHRVHPYVLRDWLAVWWCYTLIHESFIFLTITRAIFNAHMHSNMWKHYLPLVSSCSVIIWTAW